MNLIDKLQWRYATKTFDSNRKVNKQDIEFLKEAIRLSVSSFGLQLYKILIIENDEIRQELRKASWDQPQITEASHLFVFCHYTNNYDKHIEDYIQRIEQTQGANSGSLKQFEESIKQRIRIMSAEEQKSWSEKQTYLALNNLLVACAELSVDACPMEGFDKQAYNRILGLHEVGLNASVVASVGYRSPMDESQKRKKVRKSMEELFETVHRIK